MEIHLQTLIGNIFPPVNIIHIYLKNLKLPVKVIRGHNVIIYATTLMLMLPITDDCAVKREI